MVGLIRTDEVRGAVFHESGSQVDDRSIHCGRAGSRKYQPRVLRVPSKHFTTGLYCTDRQKQTQQFFKLTQ
ncbi:MAG: hypothetical protein AUH01_04185 [Acidobacteria bacterium 13_2_20CM_56_17]|nr:MAG: hypothetical protein AUH01_04185 [Acidobacteria bacterium 13_2_20CM_56_17]